MAPITPVAPMICIGTILKSHKTAGAFLCRLYNPLQLDDNHHHRLSELRQVEIRKATKAQQATQKPAIQKKLTLTKLLPRTETTLVLECQEWKQPEEIHPYHGWEIWVDKTYASPCAENEFLYCDLIDAQLYYRHNSGEKQNLGSVESLMEGAAQVLLKIALSPSLKTSGLENHIYLPFHQSIIGDIDTSSTPTQLEILDLEYFEALL